MDYFEVFIDTIINIYNGFLSLFQPTKRYFLDLTEFEKAEFIEKNKINLYYIYVSACYELYSLGLMTYDEYVEDIYDWDEFIDYCYFYLNNENIEVD